MQEVWTHRQLSSVWWEAVDRVLEPEEIRAVPRLPTWAPPLILPRGTAQNTTVLPAKFHRGGSPYSLASTMEQALQS